MVVSILKGGVLGGLTMFLWGNVSWMLLHWHQASLLSFRNEVAVAQVLIENTPRAGVYVLPHPLKSSPVPVPKGGARAFVAFDSRGLESRGRPIGGGVLVQILGGICLTWLLYPVKKYWGRVFSAGAAGLFASIVADLPNWTWWSFSNNYTAVALIDRTLSGLMAGLVIAWILRDPPIPQKESVYFDKI